MMQLDAELAARLAAWPMDSIGREYPNKIAHVLYSDEDVGSPRQLTPAFFGCFDWHSAVHAHWCLVRLLRFFPDAEWGQAARTILGGSLSEDRIAGELAYLSHPGHGSFECPYGMAWLLQLAAELRASDDEQSLRWSGVLASLEERAAENVRRWLDRLPYPIRTGEHNQSAFAMGLIHDWAVQSGDAGMTAFLDRRAREFYLADRDVPLAYEPSGHDFLSPALAEADLMRRVLRREEFTTWLHGFFAEAYLPAGPTLEPVVCGDESDGKLAHLLGLNLSRAWMLEGILHALPEGDPHREPLERSALEHRQAGRAAIETGDYAGTHWLASFAVWLLSGRGIDWG
ncbi:DUF2891 domain-containing protein [Maioricimonas rarisocia]|nr:DUF2891 domain-containing protein [Maioricimonas rarisocia]